MTTITDAERLARAVLLFHAGGEWSDDKREMWKLLTGTDEATTVTLCDLARRIRKSAEREPFIVWSNEHRGWWGPGRSGYVEAIRQAGVYSRDMALAISTDAIPGTAARLGCLPEIPVHLDDMQAVRDRYNAAWSVVEGDWQ